MVGPLKTNTNYLRQTYGERFLEFYEQSNFLKKSNVCHRTLQQLRHNSQPHHVHDVITYPLVRELFAFTKSAIEVTINRQNFGVNFEPKQT